MRNRLQTRSHIALMLLIVTAFLNSTSSFAKEAIVKSRMDERQYESIVLPNQLKVLLISDPNSDKAAAAMDVYVGSASNPKERQGLAHFLEHMLFLPCC